MAWGLERSRLIIEIDHATIINWVKQKGKKLADRPQDDEIPEIREIDELYAKRLSEGVPKGIHFDISFRNPLEQTFVECKKNKFWIWTRAHHVNHWNQDILLWAVGDRSSRTFCLLSILDLLQRFRFYSIRTFKFFFFNILNSLIKC